MSANQAKVVNRRSRAAEKAELRRLDASRLSLGEDPAKLQQQNSIFPEGFFGKGKISNLARAVGR
jgi:hypothetical protein